MELSVFELISPFLERGGGTICKSRKNERNFFNEREARLFSEKRKKKKLKLKFQLRCRLAQLILAFRALTSILPPVRGGAAVFSEAGSSFGGDGRGGFAGCSFGGRIGRAGAAGATVGFSGSRAASAGGALFSGLAATGAAAAGSFGGVGGGSRGAGGPSLFLVLPPSGSTHCSAPALILDPSPSRVPPGPPVAGGSR